MLFISKHTKPDGHRDIGQKLVKAWSAPCPEDDASEAGAPGKVWNAAFPGLSFKAARNTLAGKDPFTYVDIVPRCGHDDLLIVNKYSFNSITVIEPAIRQLTIAKFDVQAQEHGIGRREMGLHLALAAAGDVDRVSLRAGSEAGGYMHARTGYEASDTGSDDFRENVRELTATRLRALSPYLTIDELSPLRAALDFDGPGSVGRVAGQRLDLGPRLKRLFAQTDMSESARRARLTLRETFGWLAEMNNPDSSAADRRENRSRQEKIAKRIMAGIERGDTYPAGRYLMAGTAWNGKINPKDPVKMAEVAAYIGAVRSTAPLVH